MRLTFEEGTLLLRDFAEGDPVPPAFVWDARVDMWRAQAHFYRDSLDFLRREGGCDNKAPRYRRFDLPQRQAPDPHPHQREALQGWRQNRSRGVVVLPTGSGKSQVGLAAIAATGRSALVVAPTIDLMNQWYDLLTHAFETEIGLLGGGYHELQDITASTYDSAYMHMERYGDRFGLIVFDEVHHLPGEMYSHAAEMALAPYRLGLTATPERADGRHVLLDSLVGPVVYQKGIRDLSGEYLAEYRVERRQVQMVAEERATYETAREEYQAFLSDKNIKMGSLKGWQRFVQLSASSNAGRRAMLAYRQHRKIALGTQSKLRVLEDILKAHPRDRVLVFTNDNETVYRIARTFLIPAITHQTRTKERRQLLQDFNAGDHLALVTSKVLNEGVNIPEANVAVILSGSATIREHVQRLGRILRRRAGKEAVLYEVISSDTVEDRISQRRRRHEAYADGGE
ncbi:MAG: DEAD/DEAH box helicase [Candidatus Latescibacteria bacterium]|nr:DEAD/DEAH box helicase [Candidatus Latescibacterota bacterium]